MVKYSVIAECSSDGLHVIKINDGEFKNILISLYRIGCSMKNFHYHYNIMNENENVNNDKLDMVICEIVENLYFKEVNL